MTSLRKKRRWAITAKLFRFKLRTLFILVAVFAVCLYLFLAPRWKRFRVEQITLSSSGSLVYLHQFTEDGIDLTAPPPGPRWLRTVLGDNFFAELAEVHLVDPTQEEFDQIATCDCFSNLFVESKTSVIHSLGALDQTRNIENLNLYGKLWTDTQIKTWDVQRSPIKMLGLHRTQHTDAVLKSVAQLPHLKHLALEYTNVSGDGLAKLKDSKSLQSMYLKGPSFGRKAFTILPTLTQIKLLYLSDIEHALDLKEWVPFYESMPNCTIIWQ